MIRATLVILFGALPATYLSLFAGMAAIFGLTMLFEAPGSGLLLLAWGSAGIYGMVSLWFAAFDRINATTVYGLLAGCIAIAPLTFAFLGNLNFAELTDTSAGALFAVFLVGGPVAMAVAILFRLAWQGAGADIRTLLTP